MSQRSKVLREKRAQLVAEARALLDKYPNGSVPKEDEVRVDGILAEATTLKRDIDREEQLEAEERAIADPVRPRAAGAEAGAKPDDEVRKLEKRAFRKWIVGGVENLNPEERAAMMRQRVDDAEIRALSAGTGATGGYTVPQDFYANVVEAMKWYGGMLTAPCEEIVTDAGNDLPIPLDNDTGQTGELVGENTQTNTQDIAFTQKTLKAYNYSSKVILASIQFLQDTAIDAEAYLARKVAARIGRIVNTHLTTGTGSAQPSGVVTGASLGVTGTTGQTTSVIYNDLVDLKHKIDKAYRNPLTCRWMMNDATVAAVAKIKDTTGMPIWQIGMQVEEPDRLLGFPLEVNNDIAVMAASAKSILFGDFSTYKIRRVRSMQLLRLVERYADYFQVGFIGFIRYDGVLADAGTKPIQWYANSAT